MDVLGYASGKQFSDAYIQKAVPGTTFLDAGCGEGKVRDLLPKEVHYVGVDIFQGENSAGYHAWTHRPTIHADLHQLPLSQSSCDVVVLLYVLEHVQSPQKVLGEIARVMKPGAMLFAAVPFVHQVHHAPNDYFRFTKYALEHFFRSVGLTTVSIRPLGGYFRCLGNFLEYFMGLYKDIGWSRRIVLLPLLFWIAVLKYAIKVLEYPLDMLDKSQEFTSGYLCVVRKDGAK